MQDDFCLLEAIGPGANQQWETNSARCANFRRAKTLLGVRASQDEWLVKIPNDLASITFCMALLPLR